MSWKHLTFVLIPHSQSKVKQFKVSRFALMGAAVFLIVATGIMIFYIVGFQSKSFLLGHSREIRQQNELLETIIADLDVSLESLSTKIDSIETMAEVIRKEADISERDLKLDRGIDIQFTNSGIKMPLHRILNYIDHLEQQSFVFDHNVTMLHERCMANVDFLKRVPSIRPTTGFITKEFKFLQRSEQQSPIEKSHPGVDITNDEGTAIVATADGTVRVVSFSDELGRYIEIDHGNRYRTRYTHLNQKGITVKPNDTVIRGQQIALMGRTGISIKAVAPHIMYSVEHRGTYVDPADYFFASDFTEASSDETSLQ